MTAAHFWKSIRASRVSKKHLLIPNQETFFGIQVYVELGVCLSRFCPKSILQRRIQLAWQFCRIGIRRTNEIFTFRKNGKKELLGKVAIRKWYFFLFSRCNCGKRCNGRF